MSRAADVSLGVGALALAGAYGTMAQAIPVSLLSDAVGPGGVPLAIAMMLAVAGAGLLLRTVLVGPRSGKESPNHPRAAGLLALLVCYLLAVPLLGYPMSIGILAAAIASFAGARGPASIAFAIGLAAFFWLAFVLLLGIPFPAGLLFGGA
jgi:putative tricarboxylic transport membrane protein